MSDEIFFDGKRYISAHDAASSSNLTRDYIARLCRDGRLAGRRIGKNWYVEHASLTTFLVTQEFAKSTRNESLTRERTREYHGDAESQFIKKTPSPGTPAVPVAVQAAVFPAAPYVSRVISSRAGEIKNKLAAAVAAQTGDGVGQAKYLFSAPGGLAHAALSTAHVPAYALSPITEFFHKVTALALAAMLTFGTYAAVDSAYARFASNSVQENVNAALDSYQRATVGGLGAVAYRAQTHVAAAAEDPGGTFASLVSFIPRATADFARLLNTKINGAFYAVAFPGSLTEKSVVAIQVTPYQPTASPTSANVAKSDIRVEPNTIRPVVSNLSGPTTVINNPVIERVVETTRLVSVGGISKEALDKTIEELDARLSARLSSLSAANSTQITNIYQAAASAGRVEHLKDLDLETPTITGGSITGTSVSATSLAVTGSATSSFANGLSISSGCVLVNGSCLGSAQVAGSDTQVQFNNAGALGSSSNFTFSTSSNRLSVVAASTTLLSTFGTAYFGGTATSSFSSTGALTLASPLATSSGGTGISTYAVGDLLYVNGSGILARLPVGSTGQVVKVSGGVPAWGSDSQGSGGASAFATTSDELRIVESDTTDVFILGGTATSTTGNIFEVIGTSLFRNALTSYGTVSAPAFSATSTTASSFIQASTTRLSIFDKAYFGGSATSTFDSTGALTLATDLAVTEGGTGASTLTGLLQGNGTGAFTALTDSSTVGQILRVTGASTYAWGALDLADTDAITGDLPFANLAQVSANSILGNITGSTADAASVATSSLFTWTGTGDVVRGTSPTLVTPALGTPSALVLTNATGLLPAGMNLTKGNFLVGNDAGIAQATSTIFVSSTGNVGIGTTSPLAQLTVATPNGATGSLSNLFLIASSTASATTTLFSVSNTGVASTTNLTVSALNAADCDVKASTSGVFSCGTDATGAGGSFSFTPTTSFGTAANSTSTLLLLTGGLSASSTVRFGNAGVDSQFLFNGSTGFLGLGTTTPWAQFSINPTAANGASPSFVIGSSTATKFIVDNAGNVGIGTSTPAGKFSVTGSGTGTGILAKFFNSAFTSVMSILDNGTAYFLGNVGVGTTTPWRKLSVNDQVSAPQAVISYDDTRYASFQIDTAGDLTIDPSGNDLLLTDDNFFVCDDGCATGPSGQGSLLVDNKLGLGTTTPAYKLSIETSDATTDFFQVASTTAQNIFNIKANGNIGVGTSSPFAKFAIGAGGAITTVENKLATSTSMTVSWLVGNQQLVQIGTSATTISFSNYISGQILRLVVCNPGSAAGALTFTGVEWVGASMPTQTTTANYCDLWTFIATQATSTSGAIKIFGAQAANIN